MPTPTTGPYPPGMPMLHCPSCAAPVADGVTACRGCGAALKVTTALVSVPPALPARRPRALVPALQAGSGTRLAAGALLPALAGLLARELMRYLLGRQRDKRLYRVRGTIVRQVNGYAERISFDADILGRSGRD